jgi:predicted DCC family thiol-disulfide oxidoreductase YuxK
VQLRETFDRVFTTRVDARALGVTRAGVGLAAATTTVELWGDLSALARPDTIRLPVMPPLESALVAAWPVVLVLWLLAAVAFSVGWQTRVAGSLLVALAVGLLGSDEQLYSNHLYLLALVVGVLTLAGAGAAFSADGRERSERRTTATVPAWGPFLIRFQVTTLYAFSALAKLNPSYLSGSVMASYLRTDGPFAVPEAWRSFQAMFVLSLLALSLEALLAIGLWIPHWRRTAFVAGLFLHVGILLTFQPTLPFVAFGLLTLSLYVPFIDTDDGERLVIWDRSCSFCQGWVRAARRLDWLGALRYTGTDEVATLQLHGISPEAANEALHLIAPDGTWRGYDAVRKIAEVLPLTFLWAPLLGLPPVRWVGDRVYRWVALRRSCAVPTPGADPHPHLSSADPADGAR